MAWTQGFSCSAELLAAWLILRWGPRTSWPLSRAHLALIVCLCTRNEQRSPTVCRRKPQSFSVKASAVSSQRETSSPACSGLGSQSHESGNISPVAKKRKILPAFVSATIKGCILSICIGRPNGRFGHKNLSGRVDARWDFPAAVPPLDGRRGGVFRA